MRRNNLVGVVAAVLLASCANGNVEDSANAEILGAIDEFMLALGAADADAFLAMHSPGARVSIVTPGSDAPTQHVAIDAFADQMRSGEFPVLRERYWDPVVLQRNGLAVVWAPYSIDVNGVRSHCGIDVFNMSKTASGWMVDNVSYTHEATACDELEAERSSEARPDFSALDAQ